MFDQIIIIGTGRLPCVCLEECLRQGKQLICIEPKEQLFSPFAAACRKNSIEYRLISHREALTSFFSSIARPTLIVSAYNDHLFQPATLENPNLAIVNFHNSLLPRHRGRNAPTWAIFELDEMTGVTWHIVNTEIDSGQIIDQRQIPITPQMRGLDLTLLTLEVGGEMFGRIVPHLLQGECSSHSPVAKVEEVFHLGKEVPNGGILDLTWSPRKVSAFMRSLDYGKFQVFPRARVSTRDSWRTIADYRLKSDNHLVEHRILEEVNGLKIQGDKMEIGILFE